jgi:hypothetical protein
MKKNNTGRTSAPKNNVLQFSADFTPKKPVARQSVKTAPPNGEQEFIFERVRSFLIQDFSLIGDGILQGDALECDYDFELSEITPKDICIVRVAGKKFCKHVQFNKNGTVTLKSSNAAFSEATYRKNKIEILAVVTRAFTIKNLRS